VRTRFQAGSVLKDKRRRVWWFRWREMQDGNTTRKSIKIGTFEQYPTKTAALKAVEKRGLRFSCIKDQPLTDCVTLRVIAEKYTAEEMPERFATRAGYSAYLNNHILPRWGDSAMRDIKPLAVRDWIKTLPLAGKSKANVRCVMRLLFKAAMLWELIDLEANPMDLVSVKGSTKREEEPRILTQDEFKKLIGELTDEPFRTMVLTAMCLGLRCSELLALKWSDVDWEGLTIKVQRSIVAGRVDDVKTKYSKRPVPLDPALAELLLTWKRKTEFSQDTDWVWASPFQAGEKPYRAWGVQQRRLKPAGLRAGLGPLGWHDLRHTYRAWLDDTGAPMTVQQELMRHADIGTTMNIYGAAMSETKRTANSKVVQRAISA
jgi:integrase